MDAQVDAEGKRGGFRTLVASNKGDQWFFLFGFEKGERSNIDKTEEAALKSYASDLLGLTWTELDTLIAREMLAEICHGHEKVQEHDE